MPEMLYIDNNDIDTSLLQCAVGHHKLYMRYVLVQFLQVICPAVFMDLSSQE